MEELKPCLLPCNLEQLNERVLNLGVGIAQMGEQDAIRVHKKFLVAILGYMEELLGMRREKENRHADPENTCAEIDPKTAENGSAPASDGAQNKPLTCKGCCYFGDDDGFEPCSACSRLIRVNDRYARKPEGSETP